MSGYGYAEYYVKTIDDADGFEFVASSHASLENAMKAAKAQESAGFPKRFSDVQVFKGYKMLYSASDKMSDPIGNLNK